MLHPEREPLATLEALRRGLGPYNFAGQYQQTPAPAGGGMVKEAAWFQRYAPEDLPQKFDQIVQSWDTANKPSELADYSVCTTFGVKGQHFYLLHVLRKKFAYPDLKRAVRRAIRPVPPERDPDRGQGVGHATDSGAARGRPLRA